MHICTAAQRLFVASVANTARLSPSASTAHEDARALEDGRVYPAFKGSGEITSLSRADGYIEIPADADGVEEGREVVVTLF